MENEFRDVADLLTRIGSKPRYIPPKPEFLKYADIDYYEETAATLLMEQYLRRDMGLSHEDVNAVMSELHFAMLLEVRPVEYLNISVTARYLFPGKTCKSFWIFCRKWRTAHGSGQTTGELRTKFLSCTSGHALISCHPKQRKPGVTISVPVGVERNIKSAAADSLLQHETRNPRSRCHHRLYDPAGMLALVVKERAHRLCKE